MSSDLLHQSKIAPFTSAEEELISQESVQSLASNDDDVLTYGELQTQVQTPTQDGSAASESFDGTSIDLVKSPFEINNDLFEGLIHVLMRDLPGNTYDFDGDKDVLWEIQIQVSYFLGPCRDR